MIGWCDSCRLIFDYSWSFFFFKQKTAYEMRISDWSSDVCSSDLRGQERLERVPVTGTRPTGELVDLVRRQCLIHGHHSSCTSPFQIGRASCRERVCPYV